MKVEVDLRKRYFLGVVGLVLMLGIAGFAIAFGGNTPSEFGHSAGEVEVVVGGQTTTLQSAIDQGLLSGGDGGDTIVNDGWTDVDLLIKDVGRYSFTDIGLSLENGAKAWLMRAGVSFSDAYIYMPIPNQCADKDEFKVSYSIVGGVSLYESFIIELQEGGQHPSASFSTNGKLIASVSVDERVDGVAIIPRVKSRNFNGGDFLVIGVNGGGLLDSIALTFEACR